jgi:hypothetical protein
MKMFESNGSDLFETNVEDKGWKIRRMPEIWEKNSDFNIETMSLFTVLFFIAPVVRYYPLSFSDSYAVHLQANRSDKRMSSQKKPRKWTIFEMQRPAERNGKKQMISEIQDI